MRLVGIASDPSEGKSGYSFIVRPATVLSGALLLLAVGNLGRIPQLDLGERQAPLLINDICVALVLVVGAVTVSRARSLRFNDVAFAALVFAGIGGVSALAAVPRFGLSAFELVASLAYLARWGMYFALYLIVINCVRDDDAEGIWTAMEGALLLIAAFGIVQALFIPDFAFVVYAAARKNLDWDVQGNRLVSTVLDPNIAGAMIVAVLLVQLARLASGVRVPYWKPALLFAALALTFSRSGLLAFAIGLAVILFARGLQKALVRVGGIALIALLAGLPRLIEEAGRYNKLGFTDESALSRVVSWQRAIALFLESPWFGIGFNTYGFVQDHRGIERLSVASYSPEGGLLFVAVMTGVAGLGAYLAMLWFAVRRCRQWWHHPLASAEERGLLLGTGATTAAILVHTLFVNTLFVPFVMEQLWVLWGLSFVVATALRRRAIAGVAP